MPDASTILIEAARGALAFFRLERVIKAADDPATIRRQRWQSPCAGKVRFESLATARRVQRRRATSHNDRRRLQNQRPHKCSGCGGYHIGSRS